LPGSGFADNVADLSAYRDGVYWRWMANSALYAGVGALLSTAVSAVSGYALAVYRFRGRESIFNILLAGVLMPPVILAVPQYLLMAKADLTDSYLSVMLPVI
ncbi:carbohydrate ABC transporter permease, partial [Streptomyces sp. DT225]